VGSEPPNWTVSALWRHDDGSELLKESQTWILKPVDGLLYLDLSWKIQAIPDILIQQAAYGGLFVRMPYRQESGATVVNSTGLVGDQTEQQPAAWVDLSMPVNDGSADGGITILDHPGNPGHPAHWRVDGQRGINPAPCIPGSIELPAGEVRLYRYRLILRDTALAPERIQQHWESYQGEVG
jgi:hypothetical protein